MHNPVRADTFLGEFEYLNRLRCPDGSKPHFRGLRSRERAPDGHAMKGYRVRCIYMNRETHFYTDPHHAEHAEEAAVPGFDVAGPPDGRRLFWFQRERR